VGTRSVKRPEISVQAVKLLREKYGLNIELLVAGEVNENVRSYASRYPFVRLLGSVPLHKYYSKVSAVILPSRYEMMPYTPLEAQASETPVLFHHMYLEATWAITVR
jgi:glycosyltransferase involved in cell wall biosynthesis